MANAIKQYILHITKILFYSKYRTFYNMSINIHINKQMPYYNYVNYKTSNLMMIYDYSIEGGWYE